LHWPLIQIDITEEGIPAIYYPDDNPDVGIPGIYYPPKPNGDGSARFKPNNPDEPLASKPSVGKIVPKKRGSLAVRGRMMNPSQPLEDRPFFPEGRYEAGLPPGAGGNGPPSNSGGGGVPPGAGGNGPPSNGGGSGIPPGTKWKGPGTPFGSGVKDYPRPTEVKGKVNAAGWTIANAKSNRGKVVIVSHIAVHTRSA
jgi:hypothetical protein